MLPRSEDDDMNKTMKPKAKAPREAKQAMVSRKHGNIIDVAKHKPKTAT